MPLREQVLAVELRRIVDRQATTRRRAGRPASRHRSGGRRARPCGGRCAPTASRSAIGKAARRPENSMLDPWYVTCTPAGGNPRFERDPDRLMKRRSFSLSSLLRPHRAPPGRAAAQPSVRSLRRSDGRRSVSACCRRSPPRPPAGARRAALRRLGSGARRRRPTPAAAHALAGAGARPWLRLVFRTPSPLVEHLAELQGELDTAAALAVDADRRRALPARLAPRWL